MPIVQPARTVRSFRAPNSNARRRPRAHRRVRARAAGVNARSSVLFVTNGHGEAAIAARIARDVRALGAAASPITSRSSASGSAQRIFPTSGRSARCRAADSSRWATCARSRAISRAGLARLVRRASCAFCARAARRYAAVVAVGDAYAPRSRGWRGRPWSSSAPRRARTSRRTARSNGASSRGARRIFVRDGATADALARARRARRSAGQRHRRSARRRRTGTTGRAACGSRCLPGSRERAYADAERLADVAGRGRRAACPGVAAVLSIAPTLDAGAFRAAARAPSRRSARGPATIGGILRRRDARDRASRDGQRSRRRQRRPGRRARTGRRPPHAAGTGCAKSGCSATALLVVPGDPAAAADAIVALLGDPRAAGADGRGRPRTDGRGRRRGRDRARDRRPGRAGPHPGMTPARPDRRRRDRLHVRRDPARTARSRSSIRCARRSRR